MYFLGVLSTMLVVPPLADIYGRKWVVTITYFVGVISLFGLFMTHNIYEAYFYFFLLGTTFAGKFVVGYNYLLEFNKKIFYDIILYIALVSVPTAVILMTVWY